MAVASVNYAEDAPCLTLRDLSLPSYSHPLPLAIPLVLSIQDNWNTNTYKVESATKESCQQLKLVPQALQLIETIKKPVAVLSICGQYGSGKSYFLSRLLGRSKAFKLGHYISSCTRGIWMATSVLECEKFVIILLDTEGVNDCKKSEEMAMKLTTLTTLLSSFLIYNSKKIPAEVDNDNIKCFTELSSCVLMHAADHLMAKEAEKIFFPQFLWLLRDVALTITEKDKTKCTADKNIVQNSFLTNESSKLKDWFKFLDDYFPSIKDYSLPVPSIDGKTLQKIFTREDKLSPQFNEAIKKIIQNILQRVSPKEALNGEGEVTGDALANMAQNFVKIINFPETLPHQDQGWKVEGIMQWKLREMEKKLVQEYHEEMEVSLKGNLPMTQRNLETLHQQTMKKKKNLLEREVSRVNSQSTIPLQRDLIVVHMQQQICQTNEMGQVTGDIMFDFTRRNYDKSKQQCEHVFDDILRESGIEKKFQDANLNSEPLDTIDLLNRVEAEYCDNTEAMGPAAFEVLENRKEMLTESVALLKNIPGPPHSIEIVGKGPDRVKLIWQPPHINPEAVEKYAVSMKAGKEWKKIKETKKTKCLITGLKSDSEYQFQVKPTNTEFKHVEEKLSVQTTSTQNARRKGASIGQSIGSKSGTGGLILGVKAISLEAGEITLEQYKQCEREVLEKEHLHHFASIALRPCLGMVGAALISYKLPKAMCYHGDLETESDDDSS